jgi:hypothetical protein
MTWRGCDQLAADIITARYLRAEDIEAVASSVPAAFGGVHAAREPVS